MMKNKNLTDSEKALDRFQGMKVTELLLANQERKAKKLRTELKMLTIKNLKTP